MEATSRSVSLPVPARDLLTQVLRQGAQQMFVQTMESEVAEWIEQHSPRLMDQTYHRIEMVALRGTPARIDISPKQVPGGKAPTILDSSASSAARTLNSASSEK